MADRNNCFPTYLGKCVFYEGDSFSDTIGFKTGDSVDTVIEKLSAYVVSQSPGNSTSKVDVSSLSGIGSTCSGKIKSQKATYIVEPKSASIEVSFNIKSITENLPSGFGVVSSGGEIITKFGDIVTLKGDLNGAVFSPFDFPLNLKLFSNVNTPCGLIVLKKDILLSPTSNKVETDLNIYDYGEDSLGSEESLETAVKLLAEKLLSVDNKLENRTMVKSGQTLNESFMNANSKIDNLQIEVDSIPRISESSINSLQEQIDTLNNTIESLKSVNEGLSLKISQLEKNQNQ